MSQHHGRGVKHDCYGQVVFDGLWVNHKPAEDFRKQPSPASGTTAFPQEIRICNTPSDHNFSAQGASFVQQPRLRRTVTPPSPPSPSYVQSERSRPLILDSNFDSRPKQVCCYEIHKGISRTQETFRFAPASAGRKTAPKPQGYWADTVICPPQLRTHQVSGGEKPATTPIEGLSHISTLIRDQQRALEKYNENHHRQKQTKHVPYTNTVVRR